MTDSKACRKCQEVKPLDIGFHKQASSPDGRQPYCRACNSRASAERKRRLREAGDEQFLSAERAYRYAHYRRDPARYRAATAEWRLRNPERMAEYMARYKVEAAETILQTQKRYRESHRHERNAARAAWGRENPAKAKANYDRRRARLLNAAVIAFTPEQLENRLAFFGFKCWMCGGPFEHVDHVKPLSRGGSHCLANLRPSCASCNLSKHNRWDGVANLVGFVR